MSFGQNCHLGSALARRVNLEDLTMRATKTPKKYEYFVQKAHDKYPFQINQLGKKMKM